jgi:hypothetical protein
MKVLDAIGDSSLGGGLLPAFPLDPFSLLALAAPHPRLTLV